MHSGIALPSKVMPMSKEKPMNCVEPAEFFEDRMLAYRFLSRMYRTALDADVIASLLAMEESVQTPLGACIESMRGCDPEQLRIDLAAEYNRVFLGMGPQPIAPYESVYASPERLLMQGPRDEVLVLYRAESLARSGETTVPEDHIALELEFMAHLCKEAAKAAAGGDQEKALEYRAKQKDFLEGHLLKWVPALCSDMEKQVRTKLYRAVCAMTRQLLEAEREWLSKGQGGAGISSSHTKTT